MIDGYAILSGCAGGDLLASLLDRFASATPERRGGLRNALDLDEVRRAVEALRPLAERLSGMRPMRCVRGIVFDKTAASNWKVAWHQDLSIAVAERHAVAGYGPWSHKDGVVHVQPPTEVLERMLTLRLHLDNCDGENGPLRVLAGSHRLGLLTPAQIVALRAGGDLRESELACAAGDVVAMRPLLLHASSAAGEPSRRRVVHLEFSPDQLPGPLRWRWSV